jgi:hypothetical protein
MMFDTFNLEVWTKNAAKRRHQTSITSRHGRLVTIKFADSDLLHVPSIPLSQWLQEPTILVLSVLPQCLS